MTVKILIVDDEVKLQTIIRQLFKRKIRRKEFDFVFAHDGLEALEQLQADASIDLVLTDINMPHMDGLTFLAKLKELESSLNPMDHPALAVRPIGYDFIDDDADPFDSANGEDDDEDGLIDESVGHGTHIAGIVNLIAPEAQIMPLRVLNSDGRGNNFATANAILFAALNGADVINLSLGSEHRSALLSDVLEQAASFNVVVVAAAGNSNTNAKQYPAANACAISVASVGTNGIKSSFSNYGDWIDIAAPGEAIYSPIPTNDYAWWSGTGMPARSTSMATPIIAAQAALLRSMETLSLQQIGLLIGSTAQPIDGMSSDSSTRFASEQSFTGQLGAGQTNMWTPLQHLSAGTFPTQGKNVLAGCE